MKYFFILGRNHALSIQEILTVLDHQEVAYEFITAEPEYLLLDIHDSFDYSVMQRRLGGTIKIGKIIEENKTLHDLITHPYYFLPTLCHSDNKKKVFGISYYGKSRYYNEKGLYKLASEIKTMLNEDGYSGRYVTSKDDTLSSVVITKNNILEKGAEIVLLPASTKKVWVGATLSVQDFKWYNVVDYKRPAHDDKSGMLPPKLAQMMINMGAKKTGAGTTLYDPFCGSGTVLMMGAVNGYKKLFGSDVSAKAVKDTEKNMKWLQEIESLKINGTIFQHDISKSLDGITEASIDSVVTEPYLGKPLNGRESEDELIQQKKELERLYGEALKNIRSVLKKGGMVVMVLPLFKNNISIDIFSKLEKLGFSIVRPYENIISYDERGTLIYSRPNQHVRREIMILRG